MGPCHLARIATIIVALVAVSLGGRRLCFAQSAQASLAGGYGFMSDRTAPEPAPATDRRVTYHPSVLGTFAGRSKSGYISGVAEMGWARGPANYPYPRGGIDGVERRMTFLGGVRASLRSNTTPFAQMLVGYARESFHSVNVSGSGVWDSGVVVVPGGGADLALSPRSAIRVQGDLMIGNKGLLTSVRRKLFRLTASLVFLIPRA